MRVSLILAALGFATLHASADVLNGSAVVSNEAAGSVRDNNSDDLKALAAPNKSFWVGGVFSGQRRVSNVPEVEKTSVRNVFYGLRARGFGATVTSNTTPVLSSNDTQSYVPIASTKKLHSIRVSTNQRYRTVCVRLCDGHYFPISEAVSYQNLRRDEARCQARCNSPAKLYISPVDKDPQSVKTQLFSTSGEPYMALKTAYLYRTKMVPSCSCMAAPDSNEARARHAGYIEKKIDKVTKRVAEAETHIYQSLRTTRRTNHQFYVGRPARYAVQSTLVVDPRSRPEPRFQPRRHRY